MTTQEVLELVRAGFSADEIRNMGAASMPAEAPADEPQPAAEPEPAPVPEPEPAAEAAPAAQPNEAITPAWFAEFVKRNNEEMAQLQRALQVQHVQAAAPPADYKSPEQLMAEAYHAIVD